MPTTTAEDKAQARHEESVRAAAREQVTVRHTPKGPLAKDVKPYTFTCTRKAWLAGVYPAAEGFALVSPDVPLDETDEQRRARAVEEARKLVAEEEAAEEAAAQAAAAAAAATR